MSKRNKVERDWGEEEFESNTSRRNGKRDHYEKKLKLILARLRINGREVAQQKGNMS